MAVILLAAGALCLASQLLLPGFIGIASNGDFGKVYGWLCLAPRGVETNFTYFQPEYVWSARNYWDSPYHSSETGLGWMATRLAGATKEGAGFDIRWLGAIHIALWMAALTVLLAALEGRWAIAIAPVVMFTDVVYTAYFNSFFMDAAALCALLLMTASAVAGRGKRWAVPVFLAAALLFVTSKAQHSVWMVLPAAWLIAMGWRERAGRRVAWGGALAVMAAGVWMVTATDHTYRGEALFNVLFYRLAPQGADLASLGVLPEELKYRGTHSYMPGTPTGDRAWTEGFYQRTGFVRLLGWYVRHPGSTLGFMWRTLTIGGPEMRQSNLSNYRVEDGQPPGARTRRFAVWSDLRSKLMERWPWHIVVWYAAFVMGCAASRSWLALGAAALGVGEFLAASLGDSLDAGRHLFLFHAATDLTLCFGVGWLIQKAMRKRP